MFQFFLPPLSPILWVVRARNKINFMCCWSFRSFSLLSVLLAVFLALSGGLLVEPYGEWERIGEVDGCCTPTQKRGACWMMPMNAWGQAGWKGTCGCVIKERWGRTPIWHHKKETKEFSRSFSSVHSTPCQKAPANYPPSWQEGVCLHACVYLNWDWAAGFTCFWHHLRKNISTALMDEVLNACACDCFKMLHTIWDASLLLNTH